mgnify:CR=1 FL=1
MYKLHTSTQRDRQTDRQTDRQQIHTYIHTYIQNTQTHRHRQADRQTDIQTHTHTHTNTQKERICTRPPLDTLAFHAYRNPHSIASMTTKMYAHFSMVPMYNTTKTAQKRIFCRSKMRVSSACTSKTQSIQG